MNTVRVLQKQTGIQYSGVQDKSGVDVRDSMQNLLFTGSFRRGDFSQPVKITSSNIRSMLGYDPENMAYVAIEDALRAGAPYVWVQRTTPKNTQISCSGAYHNMQFRYADFYDGNYDWELFVNGVSQFRNTGLNQAIYWYIMNSPTLFNILDADSDGYLYLMNKNDTDYQRVEVVFHNTRPHSSAISIPSYTDNKSAGIEYHEDGSIKSISVCLSPTDPRAIA